MTDNLQASSEPAQLPPPETKPRPRISFVWLIPIIALIIGGWLVWKTQSEKGPTITIAFASASGIEPGKTKVKYLDVDVGTVSTVRLSKDLQTIIVTAEMSKDMEKFLTADAQFWIVQPQLTASGVSGLGTLLSGSYIGMLPGRNGEPNRLFTALSEPPVLSVETPGRRFILKSERIGSVNAGSSIYFRGVPVGTVLSSQLDPDYGGITFNIFVEEQYQDLVRAKTRFWNASGVSVDVGTAGIKVHTESLQAILTGGVAFDTPPAARNDPPSPEGTAFTLYSDQEAIKEAEYDFAINYLVEFDGSIRGLTVGAPVEFRGIQIGRVKDITLLLDPDHKRYTIPVVIEIQPQRARVVGGIKDKKPYEFMDQLIKQGLRAQLGSGSLLTGQLLVSLDFFPDAPPASMKMGGEYPQIPTVPSSIEELTSKAQVFLDKLAALPLPQLVDELRKTVRSADQLLLVQGKQSAAQT